MRDWVTVNSCVPRWPNGSPRPNASVGHALISPRRWEASRLAATPAQPIEKAPKKRAHTFSTTSRLVWATASGNMSPAAAAADPAGAPASATVAPASAISRPSVCFSTGGASPSLPTPAAGWAAPTAAATVRAVR